MPCLNVSTNVNLDGVDTSAILAEASKTVASVIGKPEAVSSPPSIPISRPDLLMYRTFRSVDFLLLSLSVMPSPLLQSAMGKMGFSSPYLVTLCYSTLSSGNCIFTVVLSMSSIQHSKYVMVVLKGSVPMAFGGTQEPAAYGELVSIGGLNPDVNKKLSAGIASILESKLSIPKSRFYLKFYDSKARLCYF
ncbi:hypothetical protein PR202_ga25004 [Eleusine coracana subsp. coracana]|uniref:Macrophage migration inhibitory factor homolog n=1 Tax=Eleusine coracana subsp. coracana TaxID=191504 RepID=A0AAV5DA22_ELECO|nr:hypothetical protein PR202_ga25004 [Eleusine coracana subsp. coracana]